MLKEKGKTLVTNIKTGYNRCWMPTLTTDQRPKEDKRATVTAGVVTDAMIEDYLERQKKRRR